MSKTKPGELYGVMCCYAVRYALEHAYIAEDIQTDIKSSIDKIDTTSLICIRHDIEMKLGRCPNVTHSSWGDMLPVLIEAIDSRSANSQESTQHE